MKTPICELLGMDLPIFAFSHCRDVVAAVTNAGGFGVLGGSAFTPEELEQELAWIDIQVRGRPYGVDIVCPEPADATPSVTDDELAAQVPEGHRSFINDMMRQHDLDLRLTTANMDRPNRIDPEVGRQLLEVSLRHPIRLVANALGVPPAHMIESARAAGIPTAALVGSKDHAVKQAAAGVDIIVAQGTEAGGHCGEVTTMVLVPEVIQALGPDNKIPVLAAGGIVTGSQMAAAIALGAAGVWTGSVWLTTREAETASGTVKKMLGASSRDTIRSRGRTGKPARQLKSAWTAAWAAEGSPEPLPLPLQGMISESVLREVDKLADSGDAGAVELATYFVGQGVGLMTQVRSAKDVVHMMAEDFITATERLNGFLDD